MIRCPPVAEPDKCLLQNNTCRRPNPWIEWMVYKGNQGYTKQQIRASYRNKTQRERSAKFTCNLTRARHRSHTRTFGNINPVQFYMSQSKIFPMNLYNTVRRKVQTEIKNRLNFGSDHIDVASITAEQLQSILEIVDEFYFEGVLVDNMASRLGQPINVIVDTISQGQTLMSTDELTTANGTIIMQWRLWTHIWSQMRFPYTHDGIRLSSVLELLIIVVQHEFVHGMIFVYQRDMFTELNHGHGVTFLTLNNRIFGHSDSTYDDRARIDRIVEHRNLVKKETDNETTSRRA